MKGLKSKVNKKGNVSIIKDEVSDDGRIDVAILIPHTHPNYTSEFFLTMMGIISYSHHWSHTQRDGKYAFHLITPPRNFAGIDKIRNGLAMIAMEQHMDYLMWMDSDQIMPPDTITKMLERFEEAETLETTKGLEAVGGLITFKEPPYFPHIYAKKHETKQTYHLGKTFALDACFFVAGVGFGCTMIKASVFNRVPKPWFEFKVDEHGKLVAGEDLGFCAKADMKILMDPSIQVKHFGIKSFDINDFLSYNKIEVKDGKVTIPESVLDEHMKR